VEAPGYPVPSHFPVRELPEGSWPALCCWSFAGSEGVSHAMDAPGSMPGLAGLHDPEGRLSLLCWPWSTSEPAWAVLERRGDQIEIGHRMELADRFPAGHVLEAGSQYVSVRTGSWEESLRHFQAWYGGMPLHVPENVPSWAAGAAIYEVHVGRAPFPEGRDHEPYASIGEITEDLSRIKNLGFEIVQLMPHWPFPGYSVDDYLDIDAQYGSEAELKELVRAAHRTGLKIILDVVLHGCIDREIIRWNLSTYGSRHSIFRHWLERARDRSPYRDEHPEWFQLEEDGDTARVYTWAFDTASHSYQDFIIRVCREYADRLGIDGFRFDAPTWNMFPNWKRDLPYRASASFYGAYELFQRLRKALAMEGRELLLFTEPSGPLFRACAHACYNYDEEWISGSLMPIISDRGYAGAGIWNGSRLDAHQLSEWLHYRRLVLPPGAITVHHLDSHDTFWWGGKAQFRREAFGASAARVLFSFFALLGGGIMIYAGAERGEESFYEQLLKLRRQREALRLGDCAFLTARSSSPNALALWRSWRGEKLLVVLNFTETALETAITFPLQEIRLDSYGRAKARDLLDGSFVGECRASSADGATEVMELMVPAYGTRILEFESGTRGRVDARST
jgi:glycosidase